LLAVLPVAVRQALAPPEARDCLLEVVLDLGRVPEARYPGRAVALATQPVERADLAAVVNQLGAFGGDNRAGIERTLHRISAIRNRTGEVVGLTCRVGRAVFGTVVMVRDLLDAGHSLLLMGRPGVGKTTALREIARVLADELDKRVIVIDTSNEIAGDGDIPHPAIGRARRMQVARPELQHQVMIEAVENHMPEVIVIDEIGTELEAQAARTIAERGVILVATAHGNELANLIKNPTLADLVGGIQSVTLGDEEARRRRSQKTVLERAAEPTFKLAVEMHARDRWLVHTDVARTVDALLRGQSVRAQVRELGADGQVRLQRPVDVIGLAGPEAPPPLPPAPRAAVGPRLAQRPLPPLEARQTLPPLEARQTLPPLEARQTLPPMEARQTLPPLEAWRALPGRSDAGARSALAGEELPSPRRAAVWAATARQVSASGAPASAVAGYGAPASGASAPVSADRGGSEQCLEAAWNGGQRPAAVELPLRVYGAGISRSLVEQVSRARRLPVESAGSVELADVVLSVRQQLGRDPHVRRQARELGIPILVIKSASMPQIQRGLERLLDRRQPENRDLAPQAPGGDADDDLAALEECRLAVEQVVLPQGQPVELLPRSERVRRLQAELAAHYRLRSADFGRGPERRLRVFPA
jgi:stage III sporulation protein SpoIIIAA